MEFTHLFGPSSAAAKTSILFWMAWPIVTFIFIRRRERSSVPVIAMLLPVAMGLCGTWVDLANAVTFKGTVESLFLTLFGFACGASVGVVAAIKLHQPAVDRGTALCAVLLFAGVAAAIYAPYSTPLALNAAVASALLAIGMFVWLFLVVRRRVVPRAVPFGVPAVAVAMLAAMMLLWHHLRTLIVAGMHR